ncbi:CTD small phosphatase-like protein 2 [Camellia lanceoleosa]|uniref:CTD small phosphatase-like protein 2 n=1 Tax=Camellia lanceoleosa TaxID=1840588 RepID=A0ACC0HE85_9ERIC|nr:CTD small phosphatase-like protein 2 [Camellia lanceoleosa]
MASYASVRQVLQPKCTKYSQFQLSPSWVVPCSLVFKTKYISRFSRLYEFSSHQNLTAVSKATSGSDAKEDEDGVSLGTMKLPLDIDIPRFESLLFQVLLTLSRSSKKRLTPIEELTSLDLKTYVQQMMVDCKNLHHRPVHQIWRQFFISQMKFTVNQRSTMMQCCFIPPKKSGNENAGSHCFMFLENDQLECFDPYKFINLRPTDVAPKFHPTTLLNESQKMKSTTLVLDLDETLVHSTLEHCEDADFSFAVFFNMKEHNVYVKQRP